MSDTGFGAAPTMAQLAAILSNASPPGEGVNSAPGQAGMAARGDHVHPRLTSATVQSLDATGAAAITFTRSFSVKPCVTFTLYEADELMPVVFKVKGWTRDANGNYTGCSVKGYRAALLPAMNGVTLAAGVTSALASFNVFMAVPAAVEFSCIALQPSNL
jgi:hypothetical protein